MFSDNTVDCLLKRVKMYETSTLPFYMNCEEGGNN